MRVNDLRIEMKVRFTNSHGASIEGRVVNISRRYKLFRISVSHASGVYSYLRNSSALGMSFALIEKISAIEDKLRLFD